MFENYTKEQLDFAEIDIIKAMDFAFSFVKEAGDLRHFEHVRKYLDQLEEVRKRQYDFTRIKK